LKERLSFAFPGSHESTPMQSESRGCIVLESFYQFQ